MEESQSKRLRQSRATAQQREILLDFMEHNSDFSQGKFSSTFTKNDRKKKLLELTQLLNSQGGATKTSEQWRKCWNDIRGYTRAKIARHNNSMALTGGGPPKIEDTLSDYDVRVANIVGWTSATGDKEVPEAGFNLINDATVSENYVVLETTASTGEETDIIDVIVEVDPEPSADLCDINTPRQFIRKGQKRSRDRRSRLSIASTTAQNLVEAQERSSQILQRLVDITEQRLEEDKRQTAAIQEQTSAIKTLSQSINNLCSHYVTK